jgi:hypothetical protein
MKNVIAAAAGFAAGYLMFKKNSAAVGANKYTYYKVIQQNWGTGWDDVDFYEVDSRGFFRTIEERNLYKENLKRYKTEPGQPYPRVILRKELNKINGSKKWWLQWDADVQKMNAKQFEERVLKNKLNDFDRQLWRSKENRKSAAAKSVLQLMDADYEYRDAINTTAQRHLHTWGEPLNIAKLEQELENYI